MNAEQEGARGLGSHWKHYRNIRRCSNRKEKVRPVVPKARHLG